MDLIATQVRRPGTQGVVPPQDVAPAAMPVDDLLRLAPFSLAVITLFLAAAGLFYSHAYRRYGDDAAIAFVARMRFVVAAILTLVVPTLMLVSFGRDAVPGWLTTGRAAALVAAGLVSTLGTALYLLQGVGRPGAFLASIGRKVSAWRLNRHALSKRWRDREVFEEDVETLVWQRWRLAFPPPARQERTLEMVLRLPDPKLARRARAELSRKRALLAVYRTDPTEPLFDAASTGLGNGNARTWRAALDVIARRATSSDLSEGAVELLVDNALGLEEAAHRQSVEECKTRIASMLGRIGRVRLDEAAGRKLAYGISVLAERRIYENRPVNAAIEALRTLADANPHAALAGAGRLGQHLVPVLEPPTAIYGSDSEQPAHPPLALFDLLGDLARRAEKESDAELNHAVITCCALIAHKLPGVQPADTVDALGFVLADAGQQAARRYGGGQTDWHGAFQAAHELRHLYDVARNLHTDVGDATRADWIIERLAEIGSWTLGNRGSVPALTHWEGRSDMGVQIAGLLTDLEPGALHRPLQEIFIRQHSEGVPRALRTEFVGICQRLSANLLGFRIELEVPSVVDEPSELPGDADADADADAPNDVRVRAEAEEQPRNDQPISRDSTPNEEESEKAE